MIQLQAARDTRRQGSLVNPARYYLRITGVLNTLSAEGYPVTKELVGRLSPYMREHVRRFGQYVLDMDEVPEPLGPEALRLRL